MDRNQYRYSNEMNETHTHNTSHSEYARMIYFRSCVIGYFILNIIAKAAVCVLCVREFTYAGVQVHALCIT